MFPVYIMQTLGCFIGCLVQQPQEVRSGTFHLWYCVDAQKITDDAAFRDVLCSFVFFFFLDKTGSCYVAVAQAGLKLAEVLLPQPPQVLVLEAHHHACLSPFFFLSSMVLY